MYSFLGLESVLGPRCPSHGHNLCSFQSTFLALTSLFLTGSFARNQGCLWRKAIEPGPREAHMEPNVIQDFLPPLPLSFAGTKS